MEKAITAVGESVQHDPHAGQPVKDDEQLDQQRGAPHHPDVHPGQLAQHRHPGKLHQGTAAAITMANAKDSTVSGMVTARPRQQNAGKDSIST